jgi:hypothetical protein
MMEDRASEADIPRYTGWWGEWSLGFLVQRLQQESNYYEMSLDGLKTVV